MADSCEGMVELERTAKEATRISRLGVMEEILAVGERYELETAVVYMGRTTSEEGLSIQGVYVTEVTEPELALIDLVTEILVDYATKYASMKGCSVWFSVELNNLYIAKILHRLGLKEIMGGKGKGKGKDGQADNSD